VHCRGAIFVDLLRSQSSWLNSGRLPSSSYSTYGECFERSNALVPTVVLRAPRGRGRGRPTHAAEEGAPAGIISLLLTTVRTELRDAYSTFVCLSCFHGESRLRCWRAAVVQQRGTGPMVGPARTCSAQLLGWERGNSLQ
jgi:hypothetical protein